MSSTEELKGIIAGLTEALRVTVQSQKQTHEEIAQLSHAVSSIASNGSSPSLNLPRLQLPTFKCDRTRRDDVSEFLQRFEDQTRT